MTTAIDSNKFFKIHKTVFRLCGGLPPTHKQQRYAYFFYSFAVLTFVTICYPLHYALALVFNRTIADIKTITVFFTTLTCSIKFIIYTQKFWLLNEIEQIVTGLDARVNSEFEHKLWLRVGVSVRRIAYTFFIIYALSFIFAELDFLCRKERSLLYPAWLPYNWNATYKSFLLTHFYQVIGTNYQITQNFIHDSFPPMACCLLAGHIKLLGMRLRLIGYECADKEENERELVRCIKDQKNLFRLFKLVEELMSWPIFFQVAASAFNICITLIAILFYTDTLFDYAYYVIYIAAMAVQIYPVCYYGSSLQYEFGLLHREVFCCNWTGQTRCFKKLMILFTERSLKDMTALAGGVLRIHLDTFFATMRSAYSLFAVIMKMK